MTAGKIALAFAAVIALPVACSAYTVFTSVATAPGRVINKTLETDNIIQNYEWFYDVSNNYTARLSQIQQQRGFYETETDPAEKSRLRMEMAAVQQSCRDLAASYNANAAKQNRAVFKAKDTPYQLDTAACG